MTALQSLRAMQLCRCTAKDHSATFGLWHCDYHLAATQVIDPAMPDSVDLKNIRVVAKLGGKSSAATASPETAAAHTRKSTSGGPDRSIGTLWFFS